MMLVIEGPGGARAERNGRREKVEDVQDERGHRPAPAPGGLAPRGPAVPCALGRRRGLAVLLLDTRGGHVTYANPAALDHDRWPRAPARRRGGVDRGGPARAPRDRPPDGPQAQPVVDPVPWSAAGGTVPGMRLEVVTDDGGHMPTGSPGRSSLRVEVAGTSAIVALFPVNPAGRTAPLAAAPRLPARHEQARIGPRRRRRGRHRARRRRRPRPRRRRDAARGHARQLPEARRRPRRAHRPRPARLLGLVHHLRPPPAPTTRWSGSTPPSR